MPIPESLVDVAADPTTVIVPLDEAVGTVRQLIAWLRLAPPEAAVFLTTPQSHPNAVPLRHVWSVRREGTMGTASEWAETLAVVLA